jgi:peptidoglycan/xylan/chitin deacetylase (PgdA/CDA1 family)
MKDMLIVAALILSTISILNQNCFAQTDENAARNYSKKICLTFDNLPAERFYNKADRVNINRGILAALKKHKIHAAGFVIGDNIEKDEALIDQWLAAGHIIGFLPFSGQDVTEVPSGFFIDDIARGMDAIDKLVTPFQQSTRYFRFPYQRYGDTRETRKVINDFLGHENIRVAHVSVITEDFVYNLSLEKIAGSTDSTKFTELKKEYVSHILNCIGKAETLAGEVMGGPVCQIIELHANRINSIFLDDVLTAIKKKGYRFIALDEALEDGLYKQPDAYYGNESISYIERLKRTNPDLLPAVDK